MEEDIVAKNTRFGDDTYYSKLRTYPKRRLSLWVLIFVTFTIYTALIFGEIALDQHWTTMAVPILLWSVLLIIYPETEKWEYKPWQSQPQKQEQTMFN
tara:strand:+ start:1032 stop:1325 length:294 start_codon:yes stop_codon:yes gene_type:complete